MSKMSWPWLVLLAVIVAKLGLKLYRAVLRSSFYRLGEVHKRAVFITGCDSGFGAALARRLDGRGVLVFAGCLTQDGVDRLREGTSQRLHALQLDVTSRESVQRALDVVQETLKKSRDTVLWGLVSNAGIMGSFLPVDLTSLDEMQSIMAVNYQGAVTVTKAFLPLLTESRGRLVATTSIQALVPAPALAAYAASKFALNGFFKSLQIEIQFLQTGVKVCLIQPSGFQTQLQPSVTAFREKAISVLPPEMRARYGEEYFEILMNQFKVQKRRSFLSTDLTPVVEAFEKALFSQYPQESYFVGPLCGTLCNLYAYLPTKLFNSIILRMYKLQKPAWMKDTEKDR